MRILVKKTVAEKIGFGLLVPFDLGADDFNYNGKAEVQLNDLSQARIAALRGVLSDSKVRGSGVLVKDIDRYLKACDGDDSVKPRSCSQFADLLTVRLQDAERHHIYGRLDDGTRLAYYVNRVVYHPPQRHPHYSPPHTSVELLYKEFGKVQKKSIHFEESDCRNMTIPEALVKNGYEMESVEFRETYLAERERFRSVQPLVGAQFWARGVATDDCDGNPDDRGWFSSRHNTIRLDLNNEPSRVLVDIFFEEEQSSRDRNNAPDLWFWEKRNKASVRNEDDDFGDEDVEESPDAEIPVHPRLAVFHLAKHLRLRCHVNNLTEYEYDRSLADKLVVPDDLRSLVQMLIEHKDGGFQDIVRGKSGGAVVLLSGPPGVGKTLTAEVYAESEARPLYSIQCSQLGIDPGDLEDELLKAFIRAGRWNAIILLDEADVYVRERANDLIQNAIVGVFLRVLEYQSSVMFLTTNRPDSVDDAVASRCVARITYTMPTPDEQRRIWRILADATGAEIADDAIEQIVFAGNLSGRDIKNLLKLSLLMRPGEPVAFETVEFVKKFRPSGASG